MFRTIPLPPYVARHGWPGIWLDVVVDWEEVAGRIPDPYRVIAPSRLVASPGIQENKK